MNETISPFSGGQYVMPPGTGVAKAGASRRRSDFPWRMFSWTKA